MCFLKNVINEYSVWRCTYTTVPIWRPEDKLSQVISILPQDRDQNHTLQFGGNCLFPQHCLTGLEL